MHLISIDSLQLQLSKGHSGFPRDSATTQSESCNNPPIKDRYQYPRPPHCDLKEGRQVPPSGNSKLPPEDQTNPDPSRPTRDVSSGDKVDSHEKYESRVEVVSETREDRGSNRKSCQNDSSVVDNDYNKYLRLLQDSGKGWIILDDCEISEEDRFGQQDNLDSSIRKPGNSNGHKGGMGKPSNRVEPVFTEKIRSDLIIPEIEREEVGLLTHRKTGMPQEGHSHFNEDYNEGNYEKHSMRREDMGPPPQDPAIKVRYNTPASELSSGRFSIGSSLPSLAGSNLEPGTRSYSRSPARSIEGQVTGRGGSNRKSWLEVGGCCDSPDILTFPDISIIPLLSLYC